MNKHERGRMNRHSHRGAETAKQEPRPEPEARDIDELRLELAHRIEIFVSNERGLWRKCEHTACGRARSCVAPNGKCPHLPPPPDDPQVFAEVASKFKKALELRYQALVREEEEEEARRAAAAAKAPAAAARGRGRRG